MEKIGLAAVMEMADFNKGISQYNTEVDKASGKTDKAASGMSKALGGLGSAIGGVAKLAAGAAIGGVAALAGAMVGGIVAATKWAEKVDNVGDVLGTTAEESSALAVAAQTIGGDVTQLTSQMAILTRGLFDAKGEIGPTGLVLQNMGIAFQDANGKMLPTTEILQSVADKIGTMPDGLEKTQLMMDLFGKSGKDMSDMMGILANGGMEAMNQKAKDMGLSMSEEGAAGAIAFGRSINDVKMMGQGLMVTIGNELMPVLQPLIESFMKWAVSVMPAVRKGIQDAIPVIQQIIAWIGDNLIPIISQVISWLVEKVPPAIKVAIEWFNEHLLPGLKDIWAYIQDPLMPTLGKIVAWLGTIIKAAINTFVTDIWPVLKTGFETVWTFITKSLMPALGTIIAWLGPIVKTVIETFVNDIWPKIKTALSTIWTFITTDLLGPEGAFTKIYNWLKTTIGEAVEIAKGVLEKLKQAWDDISGAVSKVIGFINDVIEALKSIKIPDWLKLGSPPPLAISLDYIAKGFMMAAAAADVYGKSMGKLSSTTLKTPGLTGALSGFAGVILGRFQNKVTGPMEEQAQGLADLIASLQEQIDASTDPQEAYILTLKLGAAQKEYADLTEKLNKEKERELKLQEQLNDLAYLQAQMDFVQFLAQNSLDISQILGNLQLGLGLDMAAFMDAITRALAQLVANLGTQLGTPGEAPGGESPTFGGPGFAGGGGGMAVYNNQHVEINMNVALNNGMDTEQFRVFVLDTVSGALR